MPEHPHDPHPAVAVLPIGIGLALLVSAYLLAVLVAARRGRGWSPRLTVSWCGGVLVAGIGLLGPPATAAHHDFTAHMAGHLLVGMLAPLLLVTARPVTLLMRAAPTDVARILSGVLRSRVVRVIGHPVTAAVLDAGGLWVLYTTGLYAAAGRNDALHVAVHTHVLLAGCLLTAALVGTDPAPHRPGFRTRATVLVLFAASHGILAKFLYGHPPAGVPADQGQPAAVLMYYGGDLLDLLLMVLLCRQWYAATRRRERTRSRDVRPAQDLDLPRAGPGPCRDPHNNAVDTRTFG